MQKCYFTKTVDIYFLKFSLITTYIFQLREETVSIYLYTLLSVAN